MTSVDGAQLLSDLAQTVLDEPSPDQFLSHITIRTLASLGARGAVLGVIEREGFLELKGQYGYATTIVNPFQRIPLWTSTPITDAARTGDFKIFRTSSELFSHYPNLKETYNGWEGVTVAAPITHRNTILGAISFTSVNSPSDGFEAGAITQGVLALCGLYLRNLLMTKKDNPRDHTSTIDSLTPRQKEIIRLFKDNLTTDQMAERLKYSSSTVKQDIIKIYGLFGVNSRIAVVELAEKAGLI